MVTKTSISAIRTLLFLAGQRPGEVHSPRAIAEVLGESPTYLAKIARQLCKAGILHAEKGTRGGVYLTRSADKITLQQVVEACQGAFVGDYCEPGRSPKVTCSYHAAAEELRAAIVGVLSRWTLARLMERPYSRKSGQQGLPCVMFGGSYFGGTEGVRCNP